MGIFIICFFSVFSAVAGPAVGTVNRVLMVDQDGQVNIPEVLATQAQVASNATASAIASAKASAALAAAIEGSNLVADVVGQIAEGELVVYRQGYTDAVTSQVALPPDTRLAVIRLEPSVATAGGLVEHRLTYATSRSADGIDPDVLMSGALAGGRDAMRPLPADRIGPVARLGETWTGSDGTLYPYVYRVSVYTLPSAAGYYVVYLSGDAAADDAVFSVAGGISGGISRRVPFGDQVLVFRGGLLVGVEPVEEAPHE